MREIEVCLNDKDWIPINKNCANYLYEDSFPRLLVIVDELAELTGKSGLKTEEGKKQDQAKDEIVSILASIAQLGRSAGIHVLVATQKPSADVVPTILRANLGFRAFCGRAAEPGASLVTLNNTLATTIDNSHKGTGIVQCEGLPAFVQYYYSEFEWIEDYFEKRGLNKLGYDESVEQKELESLDGNIEVDLESEKIEFEFSGEKAEIDKRQDQKWTEIKE